MELIVSAGRLPQLRLRLQGYDFRRRGDGDNGTPK